MFKKERAKAKALETKAAKKAKVEKEAREKKAAKAAKARAEIEEEGMENDQLGSGSEEEEEEEEEATGSTSRTVLKRAVPQRKPSRDPPPRNPPRRDPPPRGPLPRDPPPRDRPRCNTSRDDIPHSPPSSRCTLPDTPPSLAVLKRQLHGMQRAQHVLDAAGLMRLGELEFDIKEREKKRCRYNQYRE